MTGLYTAHLADKTGLNTACGEPWQHWQAPKDYDRRAGPKAYNALLPPVDPPRAHIDRIRQCRACLRTAIHDR